MSTEGALPDQEARDRIRLELDENLLVEAGAGSGKTTSLVARMVSLVRSGTARVGEIVAVTFTRKAAGELRERFQEALEAERAAARTEDRDAYDRIERALRELDAAFIGTIHAFASRLLRERPLEAGLDPGFRELTEELSVVKTERFWSGYLERLTAEESPLLGDLQEVGLTVAMVKPLFLEVANQPDVEFDFSGVGPPDAELLAEVRSTLGGLLDRGEAYFPTGELRAKPDSFYKRVEPLRYSRSMGWDDDGAFFEALEQALGTSYRSLTISLWDATRDQVKALEADLQAFVADGSPAKRLMEQWRQHRYPVAMRLAVDAADAWARERHRLGLLNFQDLLMYAVKLLRGSPDARRDLGRRYRRLLVDEFQDTDPIQAEVLMLLASEPEEDDGGWLSLRPRAGALFVVGDPKQSIYRFRRADMAVYALVKGRFREFGAVLRLEANFRSVAGITEAANGFFGGPNGFPEEETEEQAAFAPLLAERSGSEGGVFHYCTGADATRKDDVVADDASRLAAWIAARTGDGGDRKHGDFLVLTSRLWQLDVYASELERRGIPVDVSGAGVKTEHELHELIVLLEALADPTDRVKTISAMVGLFIGLDHESMLTHRLERGSFDYLAIGSGGVSHVRDALFRLHEWWGWSRSMPADAFVGRLIQELGVIPYAAAGPLGGPRVGTLAYAQEALRSAALNGDTALPAALEALETALSAREAEAPLEPGRAGAVRVMNLHKAKGLEAPVVVLAGPTPERSHPVDGHFERQPDGSARGYLVVNTRDRWGNMTVHAVPRKWNWWRSAEERFAAAEDLRLLYVAVTRAAEELVVARSEHKPDQSPWAGLHAWLDEVGTELQLEHSPAAEAGDGEAVGRELKKDSDRARAGLVARARAGYAFSSVTATAKSPTVEGDQFALGLEPAPAGESPPESRGVTWGSAVHGALAAAAEGWEGAALRSLCRTLLVENERPVDEAGTPTELDELVDVVESVRASALWTRASAASLRLSEAPFTTRLPEGEEQGAERGDDPYLEGVIDLAFREGDGWVIADYKTDVRTDPGFAAREPAYRQQVDLYALCWERLTGERVKERILFYTQGGVEHRW